jgi:hypothetical protein
MSESRPGYWMNETSGVLRPAIEGYLHGRPLSHSDIAAIRAYLRQWIAADAWDGAEELRGRVDRLTTREALDEWLDDAVAIGIDPL